MTDTRETAMQPEDLARFFVERANAGDAEGLAELYEPDAVLAFPPGQVTTGRQAIRVVYEELLATKPQFGLGQQLKTLRAGKLALTSTRLITGGVTAEIARQQLDGTWRWILDRATFQT